MLLRTAFALAVLASTPALADDLKPSVIHWGAPTSTMRTALTGRCTAIAMHRVDPPDLADTRVQMQIDCEGFMFQDKARHAEFVFRNGELKLVRITADAGDEPALRTAMTAEYGAPDHSDGVYDGFASSQAAIRHDTHQVVFYAADVEPDFVKS
jgi:hypothetical protein